MTKPPLRVSVSLHKTKAASRTYKVPPTLRGAFKKAAADVASLELPDLRVFSLGVILMSDEELRELNVQSLEHDFYTDIITFEIDRTGEALEAELYLSVDRARENAEKHKHSIEKELLLLVIHGSLHLAGYDDHDPKKTRKMRQKERFFMERQPI